MHEGRERFGKHEIVPFDTPELACQPVEPAVDRSFALVVCLASSVGSQRPVNDHAFRQAGAFGHGLE